MSIDYPLNRFFQHQDAWSTGYNAVPFVNLMGHSLDVTKIPPAEAMALRIRSMMLAEGAPANLDGKWGKVFHFVQMFWAHHVDALLKAGLVRVFDGEQAVLTPQALAAIHEAFLSDPTPLPETVSITAVISRAKQIAEEHDAR